MKSGKRRPERRPYRSVLREQQAAATRERLLQAALRALARDPDGASMAAVAAEADVSIPTVYRHFGTREELVAAVERHVESRLLGGLTLDAAGGTEALLEQLPGFYRNYADVAAEAGPLMHGRRAAESRGRRRQARLSRSRPSSPTRSGASTSPTGLICATFSPSGSRPHRPASSRSTWVSLRTRRWNGSCGSSGG